MKIKKYWVVGIIIIIISISSIIVISQIFIKPSSSTTSALKRFFNGNISFSETPQFNKTTQLIFEITPEYNSSNITAQLLLYDGIELVNGSYYWYPNNLTANQTAEHGFWIKPIKTGEWPVAIIIKGTIHPSSYPSGAHAQDSPYVVYMYVMINEIIISESPISSFPRCFGSIEEILDCMTLGITTTEEFEGGR